MSLDVNISEPDEFYYSDLHKYIATVAKAKGSKEFEYSVDHLQGKGDNFIANIFRVTIRDAKEVNKNNCFIVKTLINSVRQELFYELHRREVLVYTDILEKYKELQNNFEVAKKLHFPESYLSSYEKGKEILIIEDMKSNGFEMDKSLSRFEEIGSVYINLAVSEIAKLHTFSFVLELKEPGLFKDLKNQFRDIKFEDNFLNKTKLRNYFQDSFENSVTAIKDLVIRRKLEGIKDKLMDTLREFVKPGKTNVLCHGDFWINNVMFQHNESGKPNKVCFIDFQAMRYANPVTDLVHFIYLSTNSKYRKQHLANLQNLYYESLQTNLKVHDIEVCSVFPREDFERDLNNYQLFGLITALIESKAIYCTPEDNAILHGSKIISNDNVSEVPGEINMLSYQVNDLVSELIESSALDQIC